MRLCRHPDLVCQWTPEGFEVRNLSSGARLRGPADVVRILDAFGSARSAPEAAGLLPEEDRAELLQGIALLRRHGFLISEAAAARARSRAAAWKGNLAAAQYHAACRDTPYLREPAEIERYVRENVLSSPKPTRFKHYAAATGRRLPRAVPTGEAAALAGVLRGRRTVREFRRQPVPLAAFAHLLRATFGVTGTMETDLLGQVALKTSPSAGALHPVEAYVIAWNVEGLASGVYQYDAQRDELRRLRRGDFRRAAVEAASGQDWIRRAAFLCVMTAVFPRVLWKYQLEDAYRTLFLDAGHLAQTFCLVATSLGLGPFTTAAIQDSKIEKLLRIDGIDEFPVYLCGAGLPGVTAPDPYTGRRSSSSVFGRTSSGGGSKETTWRRRNPRKAPAPRS
ncbi:MAG: SagB/ThcOx family dehydrogenase [Acidobacteriota bacterium]|nr:SagB/ThcOx family dehydrogenase [Acidobacteriota bacterium]